ncbi:RluA family pseudouridine synthase [Sediminitomix flava]|uniref:Ribosomal large subunit pseudouridine synthase D n=1 Tax=Sediminitomix flava TaxID=379075 RepID=A0A315Z0C1_SEDFL|nr:RNA pseudouridine synthase [Sediminitomix flava]PWJ36083.1 ribosomal large subunit pseudouridine synthase D [Sediminitomix flava]
MMNDPFQVIYEDNHLIIVNKESGILVQGDETGDMPLSEMVKEYIKEKYNKPGAVYLGVVHRIDRPVSGLVLFAKTSKALERMNKQFQERKVKKVYWALVDKRPEMEEETLVHWIKKNPEKNRVTVQQSDRRGGQRAELTYRIKAKVNKYYLLEVEPKTGRPHQIRAQLAAMGCPILGDLKYGSQKKIKGGRIYLHSRALGFIHPTRKDETLITARLPKDQRWSEYEGV